MSSFDLMFQNYLMVLGSAITVPFLLSEFFCMDRDKVAVSELIGTTFFCNWAVHSTPDNAWNKVVIYFSELNRVLVS